MRQAAPAGGPTFLSQLIPPYCLGAAGIAEPRRQVHVAALILAELAAEVAAEQWEAHARLVSVAAAVVS